MKHLLEWIESARSRYGQIVIFLAALLLFTLLALLLAAVYALFIGVMYVDPYLILAITLVLVIVIVYKNRPPK